MTNNIQLKKPEYGNYNVLVIGDTCTDIFIYGLAVKLAPEAPVPIINPTYTTSNPGMAGNVFQNLKALGINATLLTNAENITKTRYVDDRTGTMLLRVDENDKIARIAQDRLELIQDNEYLGTNLDAIIISDYKKGFLEEDDIKFICDNNKNVFIDTKKMLDIWCVNASFIKINNGEYEHTKYSLKDLNIDNKLIVTLSNKGCRYKDKIFPVKKVKIRDVSGAGDTFLSGLVAEYLRTNDMEKAILFAQECATIVVQKPGVATV
jgi:D-beta-D-heptose 7-phosphate kinase/D-beta-D-heptose 1-phosphate adenosyltransferase